MKIIEKTTIITLGLETLLDIHAINEPKIMENVMDKNGKNNKSNAKVQTKTANKTKRTTKHSGKLDAKAVHSLVKNEKKE